MIRINPQLRSESSYMKIQSSVLLRAYPCLRMERYYILLRPSDLLCVGVTAPIANIIV